MMNELQRELANQIKKFCLDKVEPFMEEDDHNENFRMEIFNQLGELGITGITLPSEYGGADLNYTDLCVVLEEVAKVSPSYAVTISVSTMVQSIINEYGNKQQKEKFLPELTSGKSIGAFALSESGSGSDAAALRTTAKKTEGGYILNGNKMWITSGGVAKTYIVMARTGAEGAKGISAFIVEDGTKGFTYGKKEKKMGWKVSPTRELIFENCFIPEENLLKAEGHGFTIALSALDRGRITIGAVANGVSKRALDEAIQYSLGRQQFGKAIYDFQGLQFLMTEMATDYETSKLIVNQAAQNYDDKKPNPKIAAMAKMKATDSAMKITTDAVQVLGGVGFTSEYPLERFMRDAKALQIVEGTNQIQKLVIGRELKKEYEVN